MIPKELEELIDLAGGRYIIVDGGQPKYIVMNFDEYKSAVLERKSIQSLSEEELIEKINSDITLWREKQVVDENEDEMLAEIEELEDIEYV